MKLPHPTMARRAALGCMMMFMLGAGQIASAGVIYRCTSPGGVIEYSNARPAASKNCKKIALPAITTIPAPAPTRVVAKRQRTDPAFPRVKASKQRTRDNDRARILRDELDREQKKLSMLRKEYKNGEPDRLGSERNYQKYLDRVEMLKSDISRSEGNIAALQRELTALKP